MRIESGRRVDRESVEPASDGMSIAIAVEEEVSLRAIIRRGGAAVPFLFVHGLASNAHLWDEVADLAAARGHDSVTVDQRGHGESAQVEHGYDFATLAHDLATVVRAQLDSPVIAVGQSWGGNVVLEFGARYPNLVAGLGLVDGGFLRLADGFPSYEDARKALTPPSFAGLTYDDLRERMRRHLPGFSEAALDAQMANFERIPAGGVRSRLRVSNHMQILEHLWGHDPDRVAGKVSVPTAVVAVAGGLAPPNRVADFVQKAGASLYWVDGHHDVHAQQPQLVGRILLELAAEVSA